MLQVDLIERIDAALRTLGATPEPGDQTIHPSLDVLRYYRRPVRWHRVPLLGRGLSVVALVRQPGDLSLSGPAYSELLTRVSRAASGQFPPWLGLVIGLTVMVLTAEPIEPGDDAVLAQAMQSSWRRFRTVPFGLIRLNLGQEALAFSLRGSPNGIFSEPHLLADLLSEQLLRFVPPLESI